jgi:hypothetical protein
MNGDNIPKEFQIHSWSKEIEDGVKLPWEGRKPVGESETPVLGELNQPKNSKIPRRNQEITNGGLGVALTVALERKRERSEEKCEGVSSVQGG